MIRAAPQGLKHRLSFLAVEIAQGQFLKRPPIPTPRTYLLGHRALPLGAVFFWTFTGNLGRLYLGWEDIQTALPKLPLSMVKASETLHPGRERRSGDGAEDDLSPPPPRRIYDSGPETCSGHAAGVAGVGTLEPLTCLGFPG